MQSGVYSITNLENGKIYVGSTQNFEKRWYTHRRSLSLGTHYNKYLQRSWEKYDEKAFKFSILEHVNDLDNLYLVEQFWMDKYREEGIDLYNIGKYADNALRGTMMPKEQRVKISESNMGHPVLEKSKSKSLETRYIGLEDKSYPALMHKETGEVIPAGDDILVLCRERGWTAVVSQIVKMIHREVGSCNGWRLKDSPPLRKGGKPYPAFIHKETGEIIPAGVNLNALCKEMGVNQAGLSGVARNKWISCYGWMLLSSTG